MPFDVLGHLIHQIQLKRPQELWVMMRDVSLNRLEELCLGATCELRPALAVGDPCVPSVDRGSSAPVNAIPRHVACPPDYASLCCPGVHDRQDVAPTLSIRFQNVAGARTRN
jgi:hypothetical protein